MSAPSDLTVQAVVDSLSEGVYVCDLDRRITYWSASATRITGWEPEQVVGLECFSNVLVHVDKDGRPLCGKEFCPLHRSIVTGRPSEQPLLVFAQGVDGQRIPMHVMVAPIRDASGEIVGGVETFRDASATVHDMQRAQAIQQRMMQTELPPDAPLACTTHYVARDIIGGDFYAIERLTDRVFGVMLADVMGHGIAAALYTMHLSALWDRYHHLLDEPVEFARTVNAELAHVVKSEGAFATAVCGVVDLDEKRFRFASAGGPSPVIMHGDGAHQVLPSSGLPLAIMADAEYDEFVAGFQQEDHLLLFSDGAVEITDADGCMLGPDGFIGIVKRQGYPKEPLSIETLEEDLLRFSNAIRLEDDLTLVELTCN